MNKSISRGTRRRLLLPVAIGAIILIVLVLTIFSYDSRHIALLTAKQIGLLKTRQTAPLKTAEQRLKTETQHSGLVLTLTLLTPDEVPAFAPVVALINLHNTTADPFTFEDDPRWPPIFMLEILDEGGALVASTSTLFQGQIAINGRPLSESTPVSIPLTSRGSMSCA